MKPQFSIRVYTLAAKDPGDWHHVMDQARAAERAGVDRVIVSGEHVVLGEHLEDHENPALGGRVGPPVEFDSDAYFHDPLISMAMLCAVTERVRISSSVMLLALRRPIVIAKTAASLDVWSRGRIDMCVGVGWQREEFEAAGLDFGRRGRLLDHTLEVCQTLWNEQRASYSSPELSFEGIHMMPKPLQPGGVPIWVGGTVIPRAMRRLARFGVGWLPWGVDETDLIGSIPRMRDAVAAFGRDPGDVQVAGRLPLVRGRDGELEIDPSMEALLPLVEAGVTSVHAFLPVPKEPAAAEDYLKEWVEAFRSATGE